MDKPRFAGVALSCLVVAVSALGSIGTSAMGQTTPVAAYKINPVPAATAGQPTTAPGAAVGPTYTFVLCGASGQEMLCGLSPAPAGSQGGDSALTAVGFATQERSQLLGSCLQFTEQVGDTPVLCMVGITASMYTVELGDGRVQRVAGEELIRAYTSPAGTFVVRSLHALAVVDITPPRATHFVVGVADENGDVTELASWELDAASQPMLQELADAGEAVVLEVAGAPRLAQDSTVAQDCLEQCKREFDEKEHALWLALQSELARCDNLGFWDAETQARIRDCANSGAIYFGVGGAVAGACWTGIPLGVGTAVLCSPGGIPGVVFGFG
ncbi:MAG: hypothetical protein KGO50_18310, partial [Myxococcales bacterium]|nr:hypothetical protein [Myxococcales bacterium]